MLAFRHDARAVAFASLAALIEPPEKLTPTQWCERNFIVPDGPRAGETWDASLTPYICEPLDNMGPEAP